MQNCQRLSERCCGILSVTRQEQSVHRRCLSARLYLLKAHRAVFPALSDRTVNNVPHLRTVKSVKPQPGKERNRPILRQESIFRPELGIS